MRYAYEYKIFIRSNEANDLLYLDRLPETIRLMKINDSPDYDFVIKVKTRDIGGLVKKIMDETKIQDVLFEEN